MCSSKPSYGIFEQVIMQEMLDIFIHKYWIESALGLWGSINAIAPQPHQEVMTNISVCQ